MYKKVGFSTLMKNLSLRRYSNEIPKKIKKKLESEEYRKYLSLKASLREPAITRQLTSLAYSSGRKMISLAEGMPNETLFPFNEISIKMINNTELRISGDKLKQALQYIPSQGLPQLLITLKQFQEKVHGITMENKDIIITNGSQDGIYKCVEMLLEYGEPVLVQSPTYTGTFTVMKPYRPEIIGVPEDINGMIPEILEGLLDERLKNGRKMPKFMYLTPTGANPSGTVIPDSRREKIYDIACKYDFLILEDDPYQFMNYGEAFPTSFLNYDVEGRVLRFDSFSKVLSSGMRYGWITGPQELINVLELHMQASYLHSSTLTQVILNELIHTWGIDGLLNHFKSVRDFYMKKRDMLGNILDKHLTGLADWTVPEAGMFFWVKVKGVDDVYDMIVTKAFDKGLVFVPGQAFTYDPSENCPYIRLTFSKASQEDMETAISNLAELIRAEQRKLCMVGGINS